MITVVLLVAMCAFLVGAIVGNEADVRAYEQEQRDLAWADDFISTLRGTAPALFAAPLGNQDAAA